MKRDVEKELALWKRERKRKPLLVRGARQIGKSHSVTKFGEESFDNCVVINFDLHPEMKRIFTSLEPSEILRNLSLTQNVIIRPGKTLLFFDEIQEVSQGPFLSNKNLTRKDLRFFFSI